MIERKTVGQCPTSDYCKGWNDAVKAMPKWIAVKKRKPRVGEFVLFQYAKNTKNPTMYAKNTMAVGRYVERMFIVEGCSVNITHWMPLPEPPKENA